MAGTDDNGDRPAVWEHALDHETGSFTRFGHATLASMLAGIGAIAVSLWPVASHPLLVTWMQVALLLGAACWLAARRTGLYAVPQTAAGRRLVVVLSLMMGCFWGLSAWVLFPASSPPHQALLALVLTIVIAVWLPVFTLEPATLASFGAPAGMPVAMLLLSSPDALPVTAGAMLLLLFAILALAAGVSRRLLLAESSARQALQYRATHDALVDLPNHAEFHRHLDSLECRREFAILVIDLDHFKDVNDSAGHAAGDVLLRSVAGVLRRSVRDADQAGRLGGDEFAIVMADCGAQEAERIAAAIHSGIQQLRPTADTPHCHITASIGIACSAAGRTRATEVLKAADDACYRAKRRGRNRIEMAVVLERSSAQPCEVAPRARGGEHLWETSLRPRSWSSVTLEPVCSANDAEFLSGDMS